MVQLTSLATRFFSANSWQRSLARKLRSTTTTWQLPSSLWNISSCWTTWNISVRLNLYRLLWHDTAQPVPQHGYRNRNSKSGRGRHFCPLHNPHTLLSKAYRTLPHQRPNYRGANLIAHLLISVPKQRIREGITSSRTHISGRDA